MHIILEKGWEDKAFIAERTEGFDELKAVIDQYTPERVAEITGIPVEQLYQAAEILAMNKPMAVMWAMGITQHIVGVRNVHGPGQPADAAGQSWHPWRRGQPAARPEQRPGRL